MKVSTKSEMIVVKHSGVSDISDSDALNNDNCCLVDEWWVGSFDSCFNSDDYSYKYAVPFDPKTGVPLTEDVLNEKI